MMACIVMDLASVSIRQLCCVAPSYKDSANCRCGLHNSGSLESPTDVAVKPWPLHTPDPIMLLSSQPPRQVPTPRTAYFLTSPGKLS